MAREGRVHRFGSTTIARIGNSEELKRLLTDPVFDSGTFIVKPNWVAPDAAEFTDADFLRMLFEALGGRIVVVESYSLYRSLNHPNGGKSFLAGGKTVDWGWLMRGDGWNWLAQNPDWEWFKRDGHWDRLKEGDEAFLDKNGFSDLFEEFGVTYVNVTEEIWKGRIADPAAVKSAVESRFRPVACDRLYGMVPQALYDLRGSPLLSVARLKMYASFTFKNLFGMIPDPLRSWWHGPGDGKVAANIVDVNKIYHSLFRVFGICEAVRTTAYMDPAGAHKGIFSGKYSVADGGGFIALGGDLLSLDAILLEHSDPSKRGIQDAVSRDPIRLAEKEFGAVDGRAVEEAGRTVKEWISP
jgi:hypothetical protein